MQQGRLTESSSERDSQALQSKVGSFLNSGVNARGSFTDTTFERHYSIGELATIWNVGRETVRKWVKDEPGVLRQRGGLRKTMTHYSVPESIARRIHTKQLNPA